MSDPRYSPDVEIGHDGVLRWARDVAKGEVVSVPAHMIGKAARSFTVPVTFDLRCVCVMDGREVIFEPSDDSGAGDRPAQIEITEEMIEVGIEVLRRSGVLEIPLASDRLLVAEIYQSMATCLAETRSRHSAG